ncbi:Por secretion system C-terminal sorting domain-containing protein [Mucilaginibacter pineti]|uniref:Por secretion system C-terminal sorting domain-containing protein n=1 Tax=Mucilaginibacter pineti TaxID=1391627 RepID=A0A1G7GF13_9SPHI|nr:SBBP repeat-containing protein [Mucilaginibacter pineti]SDE86663.1 Por secretion system C-terminal sorting domain-containing protein [Mucilaginibacter pineti]
MAHRFLHFWLCSFFSAAITLIPFIFPYQSFAGKRPLSFIENKGQVTDQKGVTRNDIDFKLAALNGLKLFIGNGQLHYQWINVRQQAGNTIVPGHKSLPPAAHDLYRMDVQLIGANPDAIMQAELPAAYYERYYLPSVGTGGAIARTFQKITYRDVYPHIDWVFYFNSNGQLEHDFIVHPGGRPSDIKLQYNGARGLALQPDGSFLATTPLGTVHEHAPFAYQADSKRPVKSSFILQGNVLSFSTAPSEQTIVIDPVLEWGTYFGGNDVDYISDVVTGNAGRIYTTGATNSASNVATTGAYQATYGGGTAYFGNDAFISKFDQAGNCMWSTYYGTADEDVAKSITKDTTGKLYIAGYTFSTTGLASTGAFHTANAGGYDAFIAGFDTSGQRLWGSYFGGEGDDGGYGPVALHCDRFNNIYLCGQTNSATGIATSGAYQTALFAGTGDQDAFLAKFNNAGALQWSTYFGGNFGDAAYRVTNDTTGNIYLTGISNSTTGIATTGQTTNGGSNDAFLVKFDALGNRIWGTYLGGNQDDYGLGLAIDSQNNIYVSGTTVSTSGLATTAAYQTTYGGGYQDGLLAKFNNAGTLQWATYYGGTSEEAATNVYCGSSAGVFICGFTGSTGMATPDGVQNTLGGSYDGFISRFSNIGSLVWGSYIGGVDADEADAIAGDELTNLYIIGITSSATGIGTSGAWQSLNGGGDNDGFLMRIKDCTPPSKPDSISGPAIVCAGASNSYLAATAANATSYWWTLPDAWTGSSTLASIVVSNNGNDGTIKVVAVNDCSISDTTILAITVNPLPAAPQIVQNGVILSTTQIYAAYQWLLNGQPIPGATNQNYTPNGAGSYAVIAFNTAGCSDTSSTFGFTTATNDILKAFGISVFPNPASEVINISTTKKINVSLYSIAGQLIQQDSLHVGTNRLSLQGLAAGIYNLRFSEHTGRKIGSQQIVRSGE